MRYSLRIFCLYPSASSLNIKCLQYIGKLRISVYFLFILIVATLTSRHVLFEETYIPFGNVCSSRADGELKTLNTFISVVSTTVKIISLCLARASSRRSGENILIRLAHKANERFHVFCLRKHIVRLNAFHSIISVQRFP